VLPCLDADVGTNATVVNSAATRRVFAIVHANCSIDTRTTCPTSECGTAPLRGAASISLDSGILMGTNSVTVGLRHLRYGASTSTLVTANAFTRAVAFHDLGRGLELTWSSGGTPTGLAVYPTTVAQGLNVLAPGAVATLSGMGDTGNTVTTIWSVACDVSTRQLYVSDSARGAAAGTYVDRYDFTASSGKWMRNPTASFAMAPGESTQMLLPRVEGGAFVLYGASAARLFRYNPATRETVVLNNGTAGLQFFGLSLTPVNDMIVPATPSITRTASVTPTSSSTSSNTPSASATSTPTPTASLPEGSTPSVTGSPSNTPSPSQTGTQTSTPSVTPTASNAQAVFLPQVRRADLMTGTLS